MLGRWAERQPDKKAIHMARTSISYGELTQRISQLLQLLQKYHCSQGDYILLFMPNCIDYVVSLLAAIKIGAHVIPVHAMCRAKELQQLTRTMSPKLCLVADASLYSVLHSVDDALRIIDLSRCDLEKGMFLTNAFSQADYSSSAKLFLSTSGSTGKLKFVANTFENEAVNALLYIKRLGVTSSDVIYTALPMSQKFGLATLLGSLFAGCTLIASAQFSATEALSQISKHGVTVQYGVPTIYIKEKEAYLNAAEKPDISSLRTGIIAGASSAEDVFRWFDEMGCRLLNCYGTSEIGGLTMAAYTDSLTVRSQTCGHAFSGAHIEVLNAAKEPVHTGETGEIVCTTPWMMRRYEGEPKLTAKAFDENGRFLTGDIGYMDAAGNLTICGRKKELIIRGGYNVFPAEVEQALTTYTDASEACVIGYKDTLLGERICAFVKLPPDVKLTAQDLREQLMPYIAKYKLPDRVILMDDIPKLPNGKNDCPALQASLAEQLDNERKTVDQK